MRGAPDEGPAPRARFGHDRPPWRRAVHRYTRAMPFSEEEWEAELEAALGYPVQVRYGRSRTSPVQLRAADKNELALRPALRSGWVVRLHSIFAEAPPSIRADLASWIRVGRRARRACQELGAWTEGALEALPPAPARQPRIVPRGETHDLEPLRHELSASHFAGEFDLYRPLPPATWGRRVKSRARGRLHLGSFSPRTGVVRLHPVLDQPAVPQWLVRYVLFHELLHAALPDEQDSSGRKLHHGPLFRSRERAYVDYERAVASERKNIGRLLRSARSGRPMRAWG